MEDAQDRERLPSVIVLKLFEPIKFVGPAKFPGNHPDPTTLLTNERVVAQLEWQGCWRKQASINSTRLCHFLLHFMLLSPLLHIESMPFAMADPSQLGIIKDHPIGNGLDAFRASFNTVCADKGIPCTLDALDQLDLEGRTSAIPIPNALLTGMQMSRISPLIFSQHCKASGPLVYSVPAAVARTSTATCQDSIPP